MEEISKLSKNGCDDALLDYICENYDEVECELNGDEYKEPKKLNYDFCVVCNEEMLSDYRKSILLCRKCGLCEYYLVMTGLLSLCSSFPRANSLWRSTVQ